MYSFNNIAVGIYPLGALQAMLSLTVCRFIEGLYIDLTNNILQYFTYTCHTCHYAINKTVKFVMSFTVINIKFHNGVCFFSSHLISWTVQTP